MNQLNTNDRPPQPSELRARNEALTDPLNLLTHGVERLSVALSGLGRLGVSDRQTIEAAHAWLRSGQENGFHEVSFSIICDDGLGSLTINQDGAILVHPYWRQWERNTEKFIEAGFKVSMK